MRVRSELSIVLLEEGVEEGGHVCHCLGVLCAAGKIIRVVQSLVERKHVTVSSHLLIRTLNASMYLTMC